MPRRNLYSLYKLFFGYDSSTTQKQKQNYVLAIVAAVNVLEGAYASSDFKPINEYLAQDMKRQLTVNFLTNFLNIIDNEFSNPFDQLQYFKAQITVPKRYTKNGKRELIFDCPYIIYEENQEIIILNFSSAKNIVGEVRVLKGMINEFMLNKPFPRQTKYISYWDLSKGEIKREDYIQPVPVTKEELIKVLVQYEI